MGDPQPRRKRRWLRILIIAAGAVLVLLLLAPTIVGWFAPGFVGGAISSSINGQAKVSRVSLSWFGGQHVGPVTITDLAGKPVATVDISMSRGLLGLARAGMSKGDLGEIRVAGTASLTRGADGVLNASKLPKASGSSKPAPTSQASATLPPNLKAVIVLDKLAVDYTDERGTAGGGVYRVAIPSLSGRAAVQGAHADVTLDGAVQYQRTAQDALAPGGTIAVKAKADGFADSAGKLTPEAATIDADIQAKDLAVAAADALAGMDNKLVAGIGETLQASVTAKGTISDATVTVAASSRAVNVDLALKTADNVLTTTKPGTIAVQGAGLLPLVPGLAAGMLKNGMNLDRLPDARVSLDNLHLPLPLKGGPPDFRGGSIALSVQTTEITGSIQMPQADGSRGPAQPLKLAPFNASLTSDDLAKSASLTAASSATIGDQSAGVLSVNMTAMELLGPTGVPGMPGRMDGSAKLSGVATALAQPLVEKAGVQLAQDVGPRLDLELKAATTEGGAPGSLPPTALTLDVKSANVNAQAKASIAGKTIKMPGESATLTIGSAGPLAARLLKNSGVTVESGLPVTVTVADVEADLSRAGSDLRAAKGLVKVQTGAASGRLALPGQPVRAFELSPLAATLDARDLGKGVTVKATTAAKLDREPAGALDVDLAVTGVLGPDGRPTGGVPAINGRIALEDVSTAIAQPFVEAKGLDLPKGVGPTLDVGITVAGKGGKPDAVPPTDVDVTIKSAGLNSTLALTFDGRTLKTRGGDGVLSLKSPASLASKAARDAGVVLSEGGYAKVSIKNLAVAFDSNWSPRLDQSAADVELNVGGFSVTSLPVPPAAPPEPVMLGQVITGVTLAAGGQPSLSLRGSGKHQGADFFMQGALQLPGLFGKDGAISVGAVRPLGTVDLNNLPTSLAALALTPRPAKPGEKPGPDVARLVRSAVGPTATIKLAAAKGAAPEGRAISLTVNSAQLNGVTELVIDDKSLALNKLDFRDQVSPELAAAVIELVGTGLTSKPRLVSPATIAISATPITFPLTGAKPDLSKAGDASIKIGIEGKALVDNVQIQGADGKPRDLGTVGLENVLLTASIPVSSLAAGGGVKPANVQVTAGVLGEANKRIVDLKGGAKVDLAEGKPRGDLNADLKLDLLDAAWLDAFLAKPGLLEGAVGKTAKVEAAAIVKFPAAGAPAGSEAKAFDRAMLTASISAPRLSTVQPLKATALPDRFGVDSPMVVKWTMDPAWGNRYALAPSKPGDKPVAQFTAPMDVTVTLAKLALCTEPAAGPMKPGIFAADVQVTTPGSTLTAGPDAVPVTLKNFQARVTGGKEPGTLGFSMTIQEAGGQPAGAAGAAMTFSGGVYNACDNTGKLTTDQASITMTGSAKSIPTVLVDALAHQGGVVTEALGPTANVDIKTQGLSLQGGTLSIVATSPRADSQIAGNVHNGVFTISQPAAGKPATVATLKEATPKLGQMLVKGLPVLGSFEKRKEDGPATINAYNLRVPVDGDMRKLNGQVVIDLGAARFATSSAFQTLLKATGQRDAGLIGQRLQPFEVTFKDGVGTYDKVVLPLGEFRLGTSGTIDLVNRQMDVVTYVPIGALAEEAAGKFKLGIGKLIGGALPGLEEATMVPIRTKGSFDKPSTSPDLELFASEFVKTLRPDRLIKDLFK